VKGGRQSVGPLRRNKSQSLEQRLHTPVVCSIGSPCYALADFLYNVLSPPVDNTDAFVKNSEHFIKLIQDINLQSENCLVIPDIIGLFTKVPVEEVLQVIRLSVDPTFPERSPLRDGTTGHLFNKRKG
jgi:hypothetical protein